MLPILEAVVQSTRPLVIVAGDYRGRGAGDARRQQAARRLKSRRSRRRLRDRRKAMLENIAVPRVAR